AICMLRYFFFYTLVHFTLQQASSFFFCNDPATTEIYTVGNTLSLHDALPISVYGSRSNGLSLLTAAIFGQRRFGRSEEHTSELQSLPTISYAVFCLKKKN